MASEFLTSVLDIPRLIGYVREQRFEGLTLDTVLPNVEVMDIEFELTNVPASAIQVARYRAWETAPPFAKRPGYAVIAGQIPPLGLTQRLGERDQMTLQTVLANLRRNGPTNEPGVPFFPYTRLPGGGQPARGPHLQRRVADGPRCAGPHRDRPRPTAVHRVGDARRERHEPDRQLRCPRRPDRVRRDRLVEHRVVHAGHRPARLARHLPRRERRPEPGVLHHLVAGARRPDVERPDPQHGADH